MNCGNFLKKLTLSLALASAIDFSSCAKDVISFSNFTKVIEQSISETEKNDELKKTLENIDSRIKILEKKISILKGEYLSIGEITSGEMISISDTIYSLCFEELSTIWNMLELKLDKTNMDNLSEFKFGRYHGAWPPEPVLEEAFSVKSRLYEIRNFVAKLVGEALIEAPINDSTQGLKTTYKNDENNSLSVYELGDLVKNIDHRVRFLDKKFYLLKKYLNVYEITNWEQENLAFMFWKLCDDELNKVWKILKTSLDPKDMKRLTKSELEWIKDKSKYDPENNNWSFSSFIKVSDLTISRLGDIAMFVSKLL